MKRWPPVVFLRSLVFFVLGAAAVMVHASLVVLGALLPHKAVYNVVLSFGRVFMWLLEHVVGLDYVVHGQENIPRSCSVVYLKHESVWETIAELLIFPRQCWVLKHELMWVPFVGWALLKLKPIAINRGARGTALEQVVEQGKKRLAEGLWVMIYPEGTRVEPGKTRRYGLSGAVLARAAGTPVVPVAHNAGDFWPRRSFMKYPGTVQVFIGPPIDTYGRAPAAINREAQEWIEGRLSFLRSGPKTGSRSPASPGR